MSDNTWRLLIPQTKLDEQWELLLKLTSMTERERAMALARFAEANVYGSFTRAREADNASNSDS